MWWFLRTALSSLPKATQVGVTVRFMLLLKDLLLIDVNIAPPLVGAIYLHSISILCNFARD
jgi:hypothetical protein